MKMEKLTTGISYGASGGTAAFWLALAQFLDKFSPEQWAAIGVIGGLFFAFLTWLMNLYFKVREDRRKEREWKEGISEQTE
ncbi:class II holin family protein [Serratia sp. L9]|uniref:class II holin family protein n=1 Tax=Serratia sp. L9 TaxID=3423946 RepID=UPI003D6728CD